ncbi:MAG: type II toxin-antitoxin system RelE/ParE family toxin [Roseiarcus sp.]
MKVVIDDASLGDLAAIYVWIANDSVDAAASVLERIFDAIERLGRMPNIGHTGRAKDTLIVIGVFAGSQEFRRP